jgi:hypothetical protein
VGYVQANGLNCINISVALQSTRKHTEGKKYLNRDKPKSFQFITKSEKVYPTMLHKKSYKMEFS